MKSMKRHGRLNILVTDKLRAYGSAIKDIGNAARQETSRWKNNRVENSHLPFRRRERAMHRFRRMRSLQKFVCRSCHDLQPFQFGTRLYTRPNFKLNRARRWLSGAVFMRNKGQPSCPYRDGFEFVWTPPCRADAAGKHALRFVERSNAWASMRSFRACQTSR